MKPIFGIVVLLVALVAAGKTEPTGPLQRIKNAAVEFLKSKRASLFENDDSGGKSRQKRAYQLFEELKAGSRERECREEICSVEEHVEIFQNLNKAQHYVARQKEQCTYSKCFVEGTERCVNKWGGRTCICKKGWEGDDCSQNINECELHQEAMDRDNKLEKLCKNRGECHDTQPTDNPAGYRCRCLAGWTGQHCEHDINECVDLPTSPCKNKAICFNTVGSFSCTCSSEYTGDNCEEDVDQCKEDPDICQNGGICINTNAGFECACINGYGGNYCDEAERECNLKLIGDYGQHGPCPDGTICIDKNNGYQCICPKHGCKNLHNKKVEEMYARRYGGGGGYGGVTDSPDIYRTEFDNNYENQYIEVTEGI